MENQQAKLEWRGDVPVAQAFDDPYFSLENGLAETRHVFLDGNDLPARFAPGFRIAELGFGTGLNALAAWALWRETGRAGALHFTSFEAFPMAPAAMGRALSIYPELADLADPMVAAFASGARRFEGDGLVLEVIVGDARVTVPAWSGAADAWFLDGFSPAKNPELWEPELLDAVGAHTAQGGTAATYSAAGAVRRALTAAGFEVERRPGFGRKRHMVVARR
ncbi:MAG: tRNA (5-methylaminomethyl-2-thiouridine)(34)-methyltransferase MnmD [Silicimonas sp.]|nr:tRNA (5-methylaminomethyl-2-thiouridine)(34)-methyltransferase MnmD [Silicimonas sp.]